jgi:hypothetical protein
MVYTAVRELMIKRKREFFDLKINSTTHSLYDSQRLNIEYKVE